MHRLLIALLCSLLCGCASTRPIETPVGKHVRVLSYNVNWGGAKPELVTQIIRDSRADIICLQETTPDWARFLRQELGSEYPSMEFRDSQGRMGGGLAFISKHRAGEVAYIPSETGWFDGWIAAFETDIGPVQVLNVHLRPPVSDSGGWVSGYVTTRDDRVREMERFYSKRQSDLPMLICGDFNDGENSPVLEWLERQKMINALPQFDSRTPTWKWRVGMVTLKRRMDHIVYSPDLRCLSSRVIQGGASDHFPVEAVFERRWKVD